MRVTIAGVASEYTLDLGQWAQIVADHDSRSRERERQRVYNARYSAKKKTEREARHESNCASQDADKEEMRPVSLVEMFKSLSLPATRRGRGNIVYPVAIKS